MEDTTRPTHYCQCGCGLPIPFRRSHLYKAPTYHINGIKDDNRPENLIAATRAAHTTIHVKAGEILALFFDKRLLRAAEAYFDANGYLPDLEQLTGAVHAPTS